MHNKNTKLKNLLFSKLVNGFTIVELLVVIVLIGILSTITIISYGGYQKTVAVTQLKSDLSSAASAMLKLRSYGGSGYPVDVNSISTLKISQDVTLSGGSNDNGKTYCIDATNSRYPGVSYYIYSIHSDLEAQEGNCESVYVLPVETLPPSNPIVAVDLDGSNIRATITPLTCSTGTIQYQIRSHINDGAWGDYSVWSTTTLATQVANSGVKYGYQAQARCYIDSTTMSVTATGAEASYISTIPAPSAPVVAANTVSGTTTWSWPAVTCSAGTASYQYRYTISPSGYDSGWVANGTNLSIGFTTTTGGQTYTVAIQVNCANSYTTSAWSLSGSVDRYVYSGLLTAMATPTIATGSSPKGIAISADGTSVYVTNSGAATVSMYSRDTNTGALTAFAVPTVATGSSPRGIAISSDGSSVYVTNSNAATITTYNRNTVTGALNALAKTTATGTSPYAIAISPDGTSVYAANNVSGTISMFSRNTVSGSLSAMAPATITSGSGPYSIVVSSDGTSVYNANRNSDTISMFVRTTSTGALTALSPLTISTSSHPEKIAISPDGSSVYFANGLSNTISMYSRNTSTGALTALAMPTISTPTPMAISISPDGTSAYVANGSSVNTYTVSMFSRDASTGSLTALATPTITLGGADPVDIAISPDGKSVYVVNTTYGTISMFTRN